MLLYRDRAYNSMNLKSKFNKQKNPMSFDKRFKKKVKKEIDKLRHNYRKYIQNKKHQTFNICCCQYFFGHTKH